MRLRAGLVIAIEPWLLQTTDEIYTDPDGWTLRAVDPAHVWPQVRRDARRSGAVD